MTDLPPGWARTTLGDVCEVVSGATPSTGVDANWDGDIAWLTPHDLAVSPAQVTHHGRRNLTQRGYDSCSTRILPAGSLLFSSRAPIGYITIAGGAICTNQGFKNLVVPEILDSRYLYWYLHHATDEIVSRASGTTFKEVSAQRFAGTTLVFPSLAEQRRIVAALEEQSSRLDAGASLLNKALSAVNKLERGIFREYLEEPNHNGFARQPRPAQVDDGELPIIPPSWRWMRLHEIAEVVGGVTKDTAKQSDPLVPLVPYLRVANVQRGWLDLKSVSKIRVSEDRANKLALEYGDVLLNEGGDRDKLGRSWIWEGQIDGCIHQNHVFRARIADNILHPKLLAWHANSFGRPWFERNGKQTTNLASISLTKIRQLPVPVPPREEQGALVERIEDQLTIVRRTVATVRQLAAKVQHLRRSLLAEAFAGRLVLQDPEDEPGSVLLERIRTNRDEARLQRRRRAATAK